MKITLKDGMTLEGTEEQIISTMERLGLSGDGMFYRSESKGLVLIKEMQSLHLRNAILKFYKEWLDELYKLPEPKDVVKAILDGINDPTWIAMVEELSKRDA